MAKIRKTDIYPYDSNVTLDDYLIGTDNEDSKKTKSYRIGDIAGLITEIIGMVFGSFLLQGGAAWLEDLDYEVTPLIYYIGGTFYTASGAIVTLEEADDTHPRIDVIYVDTDGEIGVIEGEASANPVKPKVNGTTQLEVTFVLIEANATEPSGVSEVLVYDENVGQPTEFNITVDAQAGVIELDSELDPYQGTVHIYVKDPPEDDNSIIIFESSVDYNVADISTLHLYLKHLEIWTSESKLVIIFYDDDDTVSNTVEFFAGDFGINGSNIADYMSVIIPLNYFTFSGNTFNKFTIEAKRIGRGDYIDYIRLIGGINNPPTLGSYLALTDTDSNYTGKAGFTPIVRANETGLNLTRTKLLIDGYWVDNHGVYSETIKVGDTIEGYTSSEKAKYIIAKVRALPITNLDNLDLILNSDL